MLAITISLTVCVYFNSDYIILHIICDIYTYIHTYIYIYIYILLAPMLAITTHLHYSASLLRYVFTLIVITLFYS